MLCQKIKIQERNSIKKSQWGESARDWPWQQVDELRFWHGVWQDAGDGSHTRPEQVDFRFPFTTVRERRKNIQPFSLWKLQERWDAWQLVQMAAGNHARDHVLWFFVEHLDTGEHHAAAHLLVQVSQDVVQWLSHLGVVQGHACGEENGYLKTTFVSQSLKCKRKQTDRWVWPPLRWAFCSGRFSSFSASCQRAEWLQYWAWEALRPSAAKHLRWPGMPAGLCSSAGTKTKQGIGITRPELKSWFNHY